MGAGCSSSANGQVLQHQQKSHLHGSCIHQVLDFATEEDIRAAAKCVKAWEEGQEGQRRAAAALRVVKKDEFTKAAEDLHSPLVAAVGGPEGVHVIIQAFYRKLFSNEEMKGFWGHLNGARLRNLQLRFMTWVFGGPDTYQGSGMRAIHIPIIKAGLARVHVDAVTQILLTTLDECGASEEVRAGVEAYCNLAREQIFTPDPNEEEEIEHMALDTAAQAAAILHHTNSPLKQQASASKHGPAASAVAAAAAPAAAPSHSNSAAARTAPAPAPAASGSVQKRAVSPQASALGMPEGHPMMPIPEGADLATVAAASGCPFAAYIAATTSKPSSPAAAAPAAGAAPAAPVAPCPLPVAAAPAPAAGDEPDLDADYELQQLLAAGAPDEAPPASPPPADVPAVEADADVDDDAAALLMEAALEGPSA